VTKRCPVYIGTILLESNRHRDGKRPTYRVSDWAGRFRADGFDGMELWENHVLLSPEEEVSALIGSGLPVAVFNTYAAFDDTGAAGRRRAARLAGRLEARGVKFNLGADAKRWGEYIRNVRQWMELLDKNCRALCECHPGTVAEAPASAAAMFEELTDERLGAIIHPFNESAEGLRRWFESLDGRIVHSHVQFRVDGKPLRLTAAPERNRDVLAALREAGYAGSFTLEFTEGMNRPNEDIETSYRYALDDLSFLRDNLG